MMFKYLWDLLFHSCRHKWKVINKIDVYCDSYGSKLPHATKYVSQCENCGKIKVKRV